MEVTVDDCAVYAEERNEAAAETTVLLHGAGLDHRMWAKVCPALAVAGLGGHPSVVGTAGSYSAAPQRKLLTPSAEGRDEPTVPQFLPVH